ncbi:hypothetical protein GCK72_011215 [Caenorhabditis remanei]|uniref:F-box domain-containing protein n=1 Tax=Caenorhabditis remanei TaxID=31234 RepID=A0A6A5H532_CAERE|nr:hypothetical protein GCK72_011215 [Caenorhabditis remanei]KAF1762950.1 hypothetical protein GCK72_011215 [Caenorhabditis remanei]
MFSLKWFNTPSIGTTEKSPRKLEGPIMNMPDLVMKKIMENVDFTTMLKLRKVCHSFRNFIDETKLDNDLARVNINVTPSAIYAILNFASSSREFVYLYYIRYGKNCLFKIREGGIEEAKLIKNQDFVDAFFNDFGFILRNQSKPLKNMNIDKLSYTPNHYDQDLKTTYSINEWCTSTRQLKDTFDAGKHLREINKKYALQPTDDKFHDRFDCILKSRVSPIPIKNLEMRVLRPSYFLNMIRLIDMNQLRGIEISKAYEENDDEDGKQLDLNEIVELDVFKYIQN